MSGIGARPVSLVAFIDSLRRILLVAKLGGMKRIGCSLLLCAVTAIAARAQVFSNVVNFDGTNGAEPSYVSLAQGADGAYYGTTLLGGGGKACGRFGWESRERLAHISITEN